MPRASYGPTHPFLDNDEFKIRTLISGAFSEGLVDTLRLLLNRLGGLEVFTGAGMHAVT